MPRVGLKSDTCYGNYKMCCCYRYVVVCVSSIRLSLLLVWTFTIVIVTINLTCFDTVRSRTRHLHYTRSADLSASIPGACLHALRGTRKPSGYLCYSFLILRGATPPHTHTHTFTTCSGESRLLSLQIDREKEVLSASPRILVLLLETCLSHDHAAAFLPPWSPGSRAPL